MPAEDGPTGPVPDLPGAVGDPEVAVIVLADALDAHDLAYVFTGAFALAAWGEPRYSEDLDVVVHGPDPAFAEFVAAVFPQEDQRALLERVEDTGHFIACARTSRGHPFKVDVIRPYEDSRDLDEQILSRAVGITLPSTGRAVPTVTAEDLIVYKLLFFRQNDRHDDRRDIRTVIRRQGTALDLDYLRATASRWVREFFPVEAEARLVWLEEALRR